MIKKYILLILIIFIFSCKKKNEQHHITKKIKPKYEKIFGKLEKGETLANALKNFDLNNNDIYKTTIALNKVFNLKRSHPADSFMVVCDSLQNIISLKYMPSYTKYYLVERDSDFVFHAKKFSINLNKDIIKCKSEITSSLWNAIVSKKIPPAFVIKFSQIFQWDIDFFVDPQKGDEIEFAAEILKSNGKTIKSGNILIARYKSANYDKTAYRYKGEYYDKQGKAFRKAFLKSPLNYTRITSYFTTGRYHPVLKIVRPHNGVDFAAPRGTPVEAAADGIIIWRAWKGGHPTVHGRKGGYGKTVMIKHSNGYITLYGHLSKYGKYKKGDKVKQHDIIGYVGSTGLSTGNHLHYTVYHNGKAINPLKMKNYAAPPVPKNELATFKAVSDSLDKLLHENNEKSKNNSYLTENNDKINKNKKKHSWMQYLWFIFLISLFIIFYFVYNIIFSKYVRGK